MSKSTTYDTNDDVVTTTIATNTVTVQASRKLGRENYGNEEFGLFAQVDIEEGDDLAAIEQKVKGTAAFLKTIVNDQLGLETTVGEDGVVRDVPQAQAAKPAAARGGKPAAAKPAQGDSNDKVAQWQDVIDNPNHWFDNRVGKKNPKGPDFKGKNTGPYDGVGLWINDKNLPAFVTLWLDGEAEAA